jgi:isocitrate/isopropylmalate dehydrogenase
LEASKRDLVETEARFNSQLKILQDRGTLNETEVKKIGDMNALLFGHTNSKQKIKHVAQIKEENVKLRTVLLFWS